MNVLNLILTLILFASCVDSNSIEIPDKKKGMPEGSFWVHGENGGYRFLVHQIHDHRNNANISIFNGQNDELIVSKKFVLVCSINNQEFIENLEEQIERFDGQIIYFKSKGGKRPCYMQ